MGRRDIQFYDLYMNEKPEEDVVKLTDKSYMLQGILKGQYTDERTGQVIQMTDENEPIYGDIEVDDFNKLFRNQNIIKDQFGKSISVKLQVGSDGTSVTRHVKEDLSKVKLEDDNANNDLDGEDPNEMSCVYSHGGALSQYGEAIDDEDLPTMFKRQTFDDVNLKTTTMALQNFCKEFKRSKDDICEIFCKVSGDIDKMRLYLENKTIAGNSKKLVTWSPLEDMALTEPDTSVEFQVLLQEKGWQEIVNRRKFLSVRPVFEQEIINNREENDQR